MLAWVFLKVRFLNGIRKPKGINLIELALNVQKHPLGLDWRLEELNAFPVHTSVRPHDLLAGNFLAKLLGLLLPSSQVCHVGRRQLYVCSESRANAGMDKWMDEGMISWMDGWRDGPSVEE